MRNVIVALVLLWLSGCTMLADAHQMRLARARLVNAEANIINRCADPRVDGQGPCMVPTTWPYTESKKSGEVPSVSLIPQIPFLGAMEGMVIGTEN